GNANTTGFDVYGVRVNSKGVLFEPDSTPICQAEQTQSRPALVFSGRDYVVAWEDNRRLGDTSPGLYGARVNRGGVVIETNSFPIWIPPTTITSVPFFEFIPALASSGDSQILAVHETVRFGAKR